MKIQEKNDYGIFYRAGIQGAIPRVLLTTLTYAIGAYVGKMLFPQVDEYIAFNPFPNYISNITFEQSVCGMVSGLIIQTTVGKNLPLKLASILFATTAISALFFRSDPSVIILKAGAPVLGNITFSIIALPVIGVMKCCGYNKSQKQEYTQVTSKIGVRRRQSVGAQLNVDH